MTVQSDTFIRDILFFIKNELSSNITDPIVGTRSSNSSFVMTSYPQRLAQYPLITIKLLNFDAIRAGMQTIAMNVTLNIEVRIWARNQKEKDELANGSYKRLRDIQFTDSTGSIANNLHNFTLLSAVEVDEIGDDQPKSRILTIQYNYYNIWGI